MASTLPSLHLLAWLSPAFPVGAFAYSHGLETAVLEEVVRDRADVEAWIRDLLRHGSVRNDAILVAAAWRAASEGDDAALIELNALSLALSAGRERLLETEAMGQAFVTAIRAAWPAAAGGAATLDPVSYAVVYGAAAARQGIAIGLAVSAFAMAFLQNLVSAAVRLGPIGQTDGQRVLAALIDEVDSLAANVHTSTLDDLGGCAHRSDIAAVRHETLYSRLFRS